MYTQWEPQSDFLSWSIIMGFNTFTLLLNEDIKLMIMNSVVYTHGL